MVFSSEPGSPPRRDSSLPDINFIHTREEEDMVHPLVMGASPKKKKIPDELGKLRDSKATTIDSLPDNYMIWDLAQCKRKLRKKPNAHVAHYRMAVLYMDAKDWNGSWRSLELLQQAEPTFREAEVLRMCGDVLFSMKKAQYERVLSYYDQALKIEPTNAELFLKKGKCFQKMKRFRDEIDMYMKAIKLESKYSLALMRLGWAHLRQGNTTKALSYLKQSLEVEPNNVEILKALAKAILSDSNQK